MNERIRELRARLPEERLAAMSSIMILGLSLIFGLAEGADWTLITKDASSDTDVFVDQESIKRISGSLELGLISAAVWRGASTLQN